MKILISYEKFTHITMTFGVAGQPPKRPPPVQFTSIRELYLEFEDIFLVGTKSLIVSPCGHKVYCFEHHFFHMAGIRLKDIPELSMKTEKATILGTNNGFGHYELVENGARARHLRSARETLANPDEIWEDNPNTETAQWVCIKEFDGGPYPFSIALVGESHTRSTIIVPFSSFPVKSKNISKKWRHGKKIYP